MRSLPSMLRRLRRDRRAVSAIEAAIVMPVLLTFMIGIFELSMIFYYQAALNDALGSAARYATLSPTPTTTQVRTRIIDNSTMPMGSVTVTVTSGMTASGRTYYDLAATYNYAMHVPFLSLPSIPVEAEKRAFVG